MPKGKKFGGKDWKPGQSGNPAGKPPTPIDVRNSQKLNKFEFIRIANRYLYMTKAEIQRRLDNPDTPLLECIVAEIVLKSATQADHTRLTFLLDRMIGKVTEKIQHTGADEGPIKIDDNISDEELDRRGAKVLKRLSERFKVK